MATAPHVIETPDDEIPAATPAAMDPAQLGELAACAAVFLPADPPRLGRVAFWRGDGHAPPGVTDRLTVVRPHGVSVRRREVDAMIVPVSQALPALGRMRGVPGTDRAAVFWGAATVLALQLVARGRLLPGVSLAGFDAWRIGPYDQEDVARVRELAAAMPPGAGRCRWPGRRRCAWPRRSSCCGHSWMRWPMRCPVGPLRRRPPAQRPGRLRCRSRLSTSAPGLRRLPRGWMRGWGSPCGWSSPACPPATGTTSTIRAPGPMPGRTKRGQSFPGCRPVAQPR